MPLTDYSDRDIVNELVSMAHSMGYTMRAEQKAEYEQAARRMHQCRDEVLRRMVPMRFGHVERVIEREDLMIDDDGH